jgi:hypothetical protein
MPSAALVQKIRQHLPDDFHRQLLDGSLQVLGQVNNPVRAHLFAAGLRELFGLTLETLAPDDMVRKCAWFEQAKDTAGPTRRQRALYATRGGLHDEFLRDDLDIDPEELHEDLGKSFAELHKRTHVRPETLLVDPVEIEAFAERAIGALVDIFETINDFRKQLVDAIEQHLQREAMDALVRETIGNLDELAGHHSIEAVDTDRTRVSLTLTRSSFATKRVGASTSSCGGAQVRISGRAMARRWKSRSRFGAKPPLPSISRTIFTAT